MARIYRLSRKGLHLIQKIRRHKGHGIHSPFVFNLINDVIEEKTPYYVYEDIKSYLEPFDSSIYKTRKENKLAFRLVNYFQAKRILEIGSGNGLNTLFLTVASSLIECNSIEEDIIKYNRAKKLYESGWNRNINISDKITDIFTAKYDCIYINFNNFNTLSENDIEKLEKCIDKNSFIIVEGIRTNRSNKLLWNKVKSLESRTAALDLFNIGVVFFNTELYRWDYKISF